MPTFDHPEWLAPGEIVLTRRREIRHISHEARVVVTRQTKTSVFVRYINSQGEPWGDEDRYVLKHGEYVLTPAYLRYIESLVRIGG